MIVEVCANSVQSALNAQRAGADRIELCTELSLGGITPSYGLLQQVRDKVSIPVHVLIRPRSGDFTYTEAEYEVICLDVEFCKGLGMDGIVAGFLTSELQVHTERTEELVSSGGQMHITFHRAFDWIPDPQTALGQLEALGVRTILSSGQAASAEAGLDLLKSLHQTASQCTIMPGSGIRAGNAQLFKKAGFRALHLSAAALVPNIPPVAGLSMNTPSLLSDSAIAVSQEAAIRKVVESVK